jgi:hypothetical protein
MAGTNGGNPNGTRVQAKCYPGPGVVFHVRPVLYGGTRHQDVIISDRDGASIVEVVLTAYQLDALGDTIARARRSRS